jgi:hypothetical protein
LWDLFTVLSLSYYAGVEIEKKIPLLVGYLDPVAMKDYGNHWVGYQMFYDKVTSDHPLPRAHLFSVFLLFFPPIVLSLGRTVFALIQVLPCLNLDLFLCVQVIVNCLYILLSVHIVHTGYRTWAFFQHLYGRQPDIGSLI